VLPPPDSRSFSISAASSVPPVTGPTENVKAPWMGWASADVTRHVTMKLPSASSGNFTTTARPPSS
jgi:hypothetical protein